MRRPAKLVLIPEARSVSLARDEAAPEETAGPMDPAAIERPLVEIIGETEREIAAWRKLAWTAHLPGLRIPWLACL